MARGRVTRSSGFGDASNNSSRSRSTGWTDILQDRLPPTSANRTNPRRWLGKGRLSGYGRSPPMTAAQAVILCRADNIAVTEGKH